MIRTKRFFLLIPSKLHHDWYWTVIGYEWGAPTWLGYYSPDDNAQNLIAGAYSRFAGSFKDTPAYNYDPMNDAVYPVRGGMEGTLCSTYLFVSFVTKKASLIPNRRLGIRRFLRQKSCGTMYTHRVWWLFQNSNII
jgi:hypothetical protein